MDIRPLIIVYSCHHQNTEKIAFAMCTVLKGKLKTPQNVTLTEIEKHDLIGLGGGICHGRHFAPIIDLAKSLYPVSKKKAFIFSTSGLKWTRKPFHGHKVLKKILISKGYSITDEFNCPGFDTNNIFKYFLGGLNKGRPNSKDLIKAQEFARNLVNL